MITKILDFEVKTSVTNFQLATDSAPKGIIIYFHGGGFMFGDAFDLPETYLDLFKENNFELIGINYPLAPETKLADILFYCEQTIAWLLAEGLQKWQLNTKNVFFFGRSAGGYLALKMASYFTDKIKGIISLYGYYNLKESAFFLPSPYYQQFKKVSEHVLVTLINKQPLIEASISERYPLYMYARQQGKWMDLVLDNRKQAGELSLSPNEIKALPPLFLAASQKDPDVPSRQTLKMANLHPEANSIIVDSTVHDFDRTEILTNGIAVYNSLIQWLKEKTS